jgi:uncharacterized protein
MRTRPARVAAVAAVGLLAGLLALPAAAGSGVLPPTDYTQVEGLSQPQFTDTVRESLDVEMPDGETLYVEVVRPDPAVYPDQAFPVILEASPYHGTLHARDGTRIFPDPRGDDGSLLGLTGYFAPRGYAVVMVDLRGTGRSSGCLDHLGPNDALDLKTIVEWAADQPWSTGRVGMTGHSYVGSTPSVAAAQRPRGLVTIAPSAGLASMYDHQFQKGVPYNLQWVGPMVAYEALALERDLPSQAPGIPVLGSGVTGDNERGFPNPQTGCGVLNSAAVSGTGQVTGQYQLWHAQRDWGAAAADADIPIFMIHGVHDNAARIPAAEWFFAHRYDRPGDKVWIGQWDHGSTNGRCGNEANQRVTHPTCRFDQWRLALHAWFDRHLQQRDVDTGPPVEAFLNGEEAPSLTQILDPETWGTRVYTAGGWSRPAARLELYPDAATGLLGFTPPAGTASRSFTSTLNAVAAQATPGQLRFTSEPLAEDVVFLGLPQLTLAASVTNPQTHLTAVLNRVDPDGRRQPLSTCAIQPLLRFGTAALAPVVPAQEMALPMQCFTMAGWVPAGQSIELEISTASPHHATFGGASQVTVFTGPNKTAARAPVVPGAVLHDDVPLRAS